ncbi:MAG: hypothetical protein HDQ98_18005 [Lachnospiraceae bacterium]|nr:hypothetical protein [Lachnospiraceae bacterium]
MSTKAYYPINEIGAGKPGFSKTRSIIEAAFYGNNVVKVNTLKEAYELVFFVNSIATSFFLNFFTLIAF